MNLLLLALIPLFLLSPHVAFSGMIKEEDHMISNGQGISSPSFWDGLSGENPAGLSYNSSLKLQGGVATFDDSLSNMRQSGAVLIGNGLLGAGLEYSTYNSVPYPSGTAQINWGIGGYFNTLSTAVGVSGHHVTSSASGIYDIGALIELSRVLRLGVLVPNFTNGLKVVGGGLTYAATTAIDLVLDASINLNDGSTDLQFKPGINLHLNRLQLSAAYAPTRAASANGPTLLTDGFTGGIGLKLLNSVMLQYEYKGMPEHRLGLTLRLN